MRNFNSIKKNSDFQKVYKNGTSYANKLLIMYLLKTENDQNFLGVSVSKKVGNSIIRHRITRIIREIFRLNNHIVDTGLDIIIVARPAAKQQNYQKLESAYLHLCGLHNIKKELK